MKFARQWAARAARIALGSFAFINLFVSFASCASAQGRAVGTGDAGGTTRVIEIDGVRVSYERRGKAGQAIVFIHGWTGNRSVWRYQLGEFPDNRVIAIDLPGNGESAKPAEYAYSPKSFAEATLRVLDAEGIDRAVFVGHSMGFAVCEMIARVAPARCVGVVSVDGARFEIPVEPAARAEWIAYDEAMAATISDEKGREAFIDSLLRQDTPKSLRESILVESRKVPIPVARAMISGVTRDPDLMGPARIDIPCLALYTSAYGFDASYEAELKKTYPRLSFRFVPEVSHWIMLERPFIVTDEIVNFVYSLR
jgi:pimeloyl-ACP methyl ester carboxylesterase